MKPKPKLAYLVPTLDGIPPVIAQLYEPVDEAKPEKGFRLSVGDMPKPQEDEPPANSGPNPKAQARARRDQLVGEAIARLQVRDEHKDAAATLLRSIVHVEAGDDGELVETFKHPSGWRWPSSLPGKDFIDGLNEVVLRLDASVGFKDEWRRPPAVTKTAEQLERDDSEALPRVPRNVRIAPNATQREFEEAHRLAEKRGGRVLFDEALAPPAPPPSLSYRPGKDIPLVSGCSQAEFEAAFQAASQQGGEVVFVDK